MNHVWGFFYGGLINPAVMNRVGMRPTEQTKALLSGFELRIQPLVNLVPSPNDCVYGLLLRVTHQELAHVYGQLKATYVPQPVIALQQDGAMRPALCYIVPEMPPAPAERDHIMPLLETGQELGFPGWYLEKIRSFLS